MKSRVSSHMSSSFSRENEVQQRGINMHRNLLRVWGKGQVEEFYQQIFLLYADQLEEDQLKTLIQTEVSQVLQRKSSYFVFRQLYAERSTILISIESQLNDCGSSLLKNELQIVCFHLSNLRQINLLIAECLFTILKQFYCRNSQSRSIQFSQLEIVFRQLDKDNAFIKESILANEIQFCSSYDPFFLNQYENFHKSHFNQKQAVEQFFQLNISFVYRLIKAKNKIIQLRAKRPISSKQKKFNFISREKMHSQKKLSPQKQSARIKQTLELLKRNSKKLKKQSSPSPLFETYNSSISKKNSQDQSKQIYRKSKVSKDSESLRFSKSKKRSQPTYQNKEIYYYQQQTPSKKKQKNRIFIDSLDSRKSLAKIDTRKPEKKDKQKKHRYETQITSEKPMRLTPLNHQKQFNISSYLQAKITPKNTHSRNFSEPKYLENSEKKIIKEPVQSVEQEPAQNLQIYNSQRKYIKYDYSPITKSSKKQAGKIKMFKIEREKNRYLPNKISQDEGLLQEQPIKKIRQRNQNENIPEKSNQEKSIPNKKGYAQIQCQTDYSFLKKKNEKNLNESNEAALNVIKQHKGLDIKQVHQKKIEQRKVPIETPTRQNQIVQKGNYSDQQKQVKDQRQAEKVEENPINQKQQLSINQKQLPINQKQQLPLNKQPLASTIEPQRNSVASIKSSIKKQLQIKVGKYTLSETVQKIKNIKVNPKYMHQSITRRWIQQNQTYITQFYQSGSLIVLTLCSPLPNSTMALRLWAPVENQINESLSTALFKKYIQYLQKSTSIKRIVYNGNPIPQLESNYFEKKQKFFERTRRAPVKNYQFQFKPFVYIQCSNVKIKQNLNTKLLISSEIESFDQYNSYANPFVSGCQEKNIPKQLSSLIKINSQVENFQQINEILKKQQFDTYEASDVTATNIQLLRLYLNSALKINFVTNEGIFKFFGTNLIYEFNKECIVSIPLLNSKGTVYFVKGFQSPQKFIPLLHKKVSLNIPISVKMFSKKLYGQMKSEIAGEYGNWEINLYWEDQMKGKIIHKVNDCRLFHQNFYFCVEIEKHLLFCVKIMKEDHIF